MSDQKHIDRIWTIIEKVRVCMLTTRFDSGLRARPVDARPDRAANRLLFMTDAHSPKREEMEHWPDVCVTFIDTAEKAYLSVSGTARIFDDDAQLRAVTWRKNDVVWWPGGPNDPAACVLVVEAETAELWDGPSSNAVAVYELAKARATGSEPNLGENRKVTVDFQD